MKILVDYTVAKECKEDTMYTCYKCGKCGRVFDENGFMVDDGGTTVWEPEEVE